MEEFKECKKTKIAVIFPGIGYHTDKPLLYYGKKLAAANGFQVKDVSYGGFAFGIKGDPDKMQLAFQSALEQSEEILQDVDFSSYDTILFISKSIGTAVAAAYARRKHLKTCNIVYTPVEQTFLLMNQPGLLFHGTNDPWMPHDLFMKLCAQTGYPYRLIEGGNHSLETGDVLTDLRNLQMIMEETNKYLKAQIMSDGGSESKAIWKIVQIFDGDYGCEELAPGEKPKVSVTLENKNGEQIYKSVEDDWLVANGLDVGSIWPSFAAWKDPQT